MNIALRYRISISPSRYSSSKFSRYHCLCYKRLGQIETIIDAVETTIKRVGNMRSDVYINCPCDEDDSYVDALPVILIVVLCLLLIILNNKRQHLCG